jgi:hypothetical protein
MGKERERHMHWNGIACHTPQNSTCPLLAVVSNRQSRRMRGQRDKSAVASHGGTPLRAATASIRQLLYVVLGSRRLDGGPAHTDGEFSPSVSLVWVPHQEIPSSDLEGVCDPTLAAFSPRAGRSSL